MDRLVAAAERLASLAGSGADADRLAAELRATARQWRDEAVRDAERLRRRIASLGIRLEADSDAAMDLGMVAEGRRLERTARSLRTAADRLSERDGRSR